MPHRCNATFPPFWENHPYAQLPFLSSRRRQRGGRARSNRDICWLIGVKGVARRNTPIDSSGLIVSIKRGIICCCVSCLPAFNGAHIHWGRRNWRRARRLRWLGAVSLVCSNHGHTSQHIEWVARQIEVIEAGCDNWVLVTEV